MVWTRAQGGWIRWLSTLLLLGGVVGDPFLSAADQSVNLSWVASPSDGVAGYNVYYGASSGAYSNLLVAGDATNLIIPGLVEGATYYFAVSAYDVAGVESPLSTEAVYWVPATNSSKPTLPPTLSVIADQTINKNSSVGPIEFVVGDPDTDISNLTLSAFSSYPLLVSVANLVFGGAGSNRTLQLTPAPNLSGTATLGVMVSDNTGNSSYRQFTLTVLPSTGAGSGTPVVSAVPDLTLNANSPATNVSFAVADSDTPAASLAVSVTTDNPLLFPAANLVVLGSGSTRLLRVTPAINRSGTAHLIVAATDPVGYTGTSTNTVTVLASSGVPSLILLTTGSGRVTPNLGVRALVTGRRYTVTAVPAPGNLFVGWTGSVISTAPVLSFKLSAGMTLQANFIPNPYLPVSGSYSGLFWENAGVQVASSGAFAAVLTRSGAYSGRVVIGGHSYPFSGKLNLLCQASNRLKRGTNVLNLSMQADSAGRITGTLAEDNWIAALQAIRAGFNARTNPAPQTARYTMVVPGHAGATVLPAGMGFGAVSVSPGGLAKVAGSLADGTKFSQSAYLSKDGIWPIYAPIYAGKGLLASWQTFEHQNTTDFNGWMIWIKPANPAWNYPAGFNFEMTAFGELYTPPKGTNLIFQLPVGQIACAYGDLPENFNYAIDMAPGNKVTNLQTNKLILKFSLSTGTFNGVVDDPVLNAPWPFRGVVLQNDGVGYGFIAGTNLYGQAALFPR